MSALDPAALAAWQGAVGRTETRYELCEFESLRRYALAVGADPAIETALPPLPHWAFFLPAPAGHGQHLARADREAHLPMVRLFLHVGRGKRRLDPGDDAQRRWVGGQVPAPRC